PNDLGNMVVMATQPFDVEETTFGGFTYAFGFAVAVENSANQIDPFVQHGTITIRLQSNPGGGALGGTLTLPVSDGLAIFDGLTVNAPGQGYTIQATYSDGLNAPISDPFNVSGPATKLVVTTQPPTNVGAGVPFTVSVSAE